MAIRARGRENAQYKAKERDEFFRRLDRGGTIRAVAAELARPDLVDLETFDAGHTLSWNSDPSRWQTTVTAWLQEHAER